MNYILIIFQTNCKKKLQESRLLKYSSGKSKLFLTTDKQKSKKIAVFTNDWSFFWQKYIPPRTFFHRYAVVKKQNVRKNGGAGYFLKGEGRGRQEGVR